MPWAVVAIVGIAVVLPLGAWLMTRRRAKEPPRLMYDELVRAWFDQNLGHLSGEQRYQVRSAVAKGRKVSDPALEGAAHFLAEQILSGDLPGPRLERLRGWLLFGYGLAWIGGFIALLVWAGPPPPGNRGGYGEGLAIAGLFLLISAIRFYILEPRRRRRAAQRALKLNQAPADAPQNQ